EPQISARVLVQSRNLAKAQALVRRVGAKSANRVFGVRSEFDQSLIRAGPEPVVRGFEETKDPRGGQTIPDRECAGNRDGLARRIRGYLKKSAVPGRHPQASSMVHKQIMQMVIGRRESVVFGVPRRTSVMPSPIQPAWRGHP